MVLHTDFCWCWKMLNVRPGDHHAHAHHAHDSRRGDDPHVRGVPLRHLVPQENDKEIHRLQRVAPNHTMP